MDPYANAFLSEGVRGGASGLDDFPDAEERASDLRRIASLIRLAASALNLLADALSRDSARIAARRDS